MNNALSTDDRLTALEAQQFDLLRRLADLEAIAIALTQHDTNFGAAVSAISLAVQGSLDSDTLNHFQ